MWAEGGDHNGKVHWTCRLWYYYWAKSKSASTKEEKKLIKTQYQNVRISGPSFKTIRIPVVKSCKTIIMRSDEKYKIKSNCQFFLIFARFCNFRDWNFQKFRVDKISRISSSQNFRVDLISRKWPKYAKLAKINPREN